MLAGIEGICGEVDTARIENTIKRLEIVRRSEPIRMAKYQSHVMRSATDFEVPGKCFELFVF